MRVKVWDVPLRLFHWLLVIAVTGSLASATLGEAWMHWHQRFGLAVIGMLGFRLAWGLRGSGEARFASFLPTPERLMAQYNGRWRGAGHTPLGALSVLAMLGLFGFQAITGLFATDDVSFSGPWANAVSSELSRLLSSWHRSTEEWLYALIAVHLLAIAVYQVRGRKLLGAMIHGRKEVTDDVERPRPAGKLALFGALIVAALAVWLASGL